MRKLLSITFLLLSVCSPSVAQRDALRGVAQHLNSIKPFVVSVKQTRTDSSDGQTTTAKGYFYCKSAKLHSMVFRNSKEMLLFKDGIYTIAKDGKQHSTKVSGKGLNPFETINEILQNALSGNEKTALTKQAKITYTKQGNTCVVNITPIRSGFLASLKALYKSCSLTIDLKTNEIKSLYIHERGNFKTRYDFSNCKTNNSIDNQVFEIAF